VAGDRTAEIMTVAAAVSAAFGVLVRERHACLYKSSGGSLHPTKYAARDLFHGITV
jgi:hypothetical protein